jgi:hypothetical protein
VSGNRYGPYIRAAGAKDSPPEPDELKANASNASKYPRLEFISASALSSIPPREFYLGKRYQRSAVSGTMAPGGRGKSSLDPVEAVSMAIGRDLLLRSRRAALRSGTTTARRI